MRTEPKLFPKIVGQERAKRRLKFYLDGYKASNIIPHLMFIAPKGCGKTMLAKAVGKHLVQKDDPSKPKPFLEINCSTIKSVKQLFNQIIIPHVNNKECTILFDEASELPKDVTMALLTVLNPNASNRTSFSVEDYVVDFDFSMQSFIFATTEAQHIFHALMDRCERIDLEEYSYDELGEIVKRVLPEVKFDKVALKNVSSVLRGNARAAQKMAGNIRTYLASRRKSKFNAEDWGYLKHHLAILPLGLSPIELQVLEFLDGRKNCSLTYLAAKTGLTKACLQRDFEMYLQKHNLMEITTEGRAITTKGKKYLKSFQKEEAAHA
tara:strand:+ start:773 stop:1741 length:969 start_codon:yes stop_codon:yes gene_type:complete